MFILLKILLFFVRPIVWITILFIAGLLIKNPRRKTYTIKLGIILFLFFSNPFIIRQLIQWYQLKPVELKESVHYNAGIVLGGFVSYNLKDDKAYFNSACDRFIQTALLYKTGKIEKVIVAAGNGYIVKHDFKESDFIKKHLVELGIPDSVILTDPNSRNTLENAINSKKIIDSTGLKGPFLLISSALHLPRAINVFAKKGIDVIAYPCDYMSENGGNNFFEDYILPSAMALKNWDAYLKEITGLLAYKITGKG